MSVRFDGRTPATQWDFDGVSAPEASKVEPEAKRYDPSDWLRGRHVGVQDVVRLLEKKIAEIERLRNPEPWESRRYWNWDALNSEQLTYECLIGEIRRTFLEEGPVAR